MSRLTSVLTLILFLLWIMPLGAFIDPSNEDKACGGQRAICLCAHLLKKSEDRSAGKNILIVAPTFAKESISGGNAAYDSIAQTKNIPNLTFSAHQFNSAEPFALAVDRSIDKVPKA
jgi:hypothetical protein